MAAPSKKSWWKSLVPGWRAVRRLSQLAFLVLFAWLFRSTAYSDSNILHRPVNLFFHMDPLVGASAMLAGKVLLAAFWPALLLLMLTLIFGRFFLRLGLSDRNRAGLCSPPLAAHHTPHNYLGAKIRLPLATDALYRVAACLTDSLFRLAAGGISGPFFPLDAALDHGIGSSVVLRINRSGGPLLSLSTLVGQAGEFHLWIYGEPSHHSLWKQRLSSCRCDPGYSGDCGLAGICGAAILVPIFVSAGRHVRTGGTLVSGSSLAGKNVCRLPGQGKLRCPVSHGIV